jgi:hypothetical protein
MFYQGGHTRIAAHYSARQSRYLARHFPLRDYYHSKRPCPKKLSTFVPSGQIIKHYLNPQGRQRPLGRVLERKTSNSSGGGSGEVRAALDPMRNLEVTG